MDPELRRRICRKADNALNSDKQATHRPETALNPWTWKLRSFRASRGPAAPWCPPRRMLGVWSRGSLFIVEFKDASLGEFRGIGSNACAEQLLGFRVLRQVHV